MVTGHRISPAAWSANLATQAPPPAPLDGRKGEPEIRSLVQALVLRALQGEQTALRDLDRRLRPAVRGFFLKHLRTLSADVDDATQITLAEALRSLTSGYYDPTRASFTTFVYGVARRIRLRFVLAQRDGRNCLTGPTTQGIGSPVEWPTSIDQEAALLDQIEKMNACLHRDTGPTCLTPEERFVAVARARGETFESLATTLDCSLDTVFRRNVSALAKLRRCLTTHGVIQ